MLLSKAGNGYGPWPNVGLLGALLKGMDGEVGRGKLKGRIQTHNPLILRPC